MGAETTCDNALVPGDIRVLGRDYAALPFKGSGKASRSSNAVFPGNIRILGGPMPFLASVGFRWPPVCQCKGSGTAARSVNDVFPGNIRTLCVWGEYGNPKV